MAFQTFNLADLTACPDSLESLAQLGEITTLPASAPLPEIMRELASCDLYFASLELRLTRSLLEASPRLRFIVTPSTGLDHIDLVAATELGKEVISLKGETDFLGSITATAEQAWGLLLAAVRMIPAGHAAAVRGDWGRDRFRGRQLSGKTLGVLGYGRLGRIVADYGRAFRMRVIACEADPMVKFPPDVAPVNFGTLLRESDVISIHIHLSEENRHLFGRSAFSQMKPGAVVVNTSRGAIIDEAALLDALASGRVSAAGLDVIDGEWEPDLNAHPVICYAREHPNVVVSPHVGGVTFESQGAAFRFVAEKASKRVMASPPFSG